MADRESRLAKELKNMERLRDLSRGWLTFQVSDFAQKYLVTLLCTGVSLHAGQLRETREHRVVIHLGPDFPNEKPFLAWQTPIYHPNIFTYQVCPGESWGEARGLDDLCIELWDMVRYKTYNLASFLDSAAVKWARENQSRFPLDPRDLRALALHVVERSEREVLDSIRVLPG